MKLLRLFNDQLPELIMYDLDGTLVDSLQDLTTAIDKMLTDFGHPAAGIKKVKLWIGNGIPSLVRRALGGDLSSSNSASEHTLLFEQAIKCFQKHYANEVGRYTVMYPGVQHFLQTMSNKGIKQTIITNKSAVFTEKLLKRIGIGSFFSLILSADSLPEKKPHPMPLLHTIKECGCSVSQSLMIGDSCNDIEAARAAGVKAAGLTYGYNYGKPIATANPDVVLSKLSDLL